MRSPSCAIGATASATERCWRTDAGSWSQTVLPSAMVPARPTTPVCASSASTSVVLPAPDGPTSTTLRIREGSVTAAPECAARRDPVAALPAMATTSAPLRLVSGPSHTRAAVVTTLAARLCGCRKVRKVDDGHGCSAAPVSVPGRRPGWGVPSLQTISTSPQWVAGGVRQVFRRE
jgi:hypothetical protein